MGGMGGWGVPTEYLVAPVLNWTGLGCDNWSLQPYIWAIDPNLFCWAYVHHNFSKESFSEPFGPHRSKTKRKINRKEIRCNTFYP